MSIEQYWPIITLYIMFAIGFAISAFQGIDNKFKGFFICIFVGMFWPVIMAHRIAQYSIY